MIMASSNLQTNLTAFILCFFLAGANSAMGQKIAPPEPLNRPADPLNRDPRRPDQNDYEVRTAISEVASKVEVETALKEAKEAFEAKPPRYADAEACYLRATKANPKEARAYLGLGNVYAAQNRVADAISSLQKAIDAAPKFAAAHFNLGLIFSAIGNKDGALKEYETLVGLDKALAEKLEQIIKP